MRRPVCARRTRRPKRLEWARNVIDRQVDHLTRLIDDLLDVSRITRGRVSLNLEPVEIDAIVSRAVEAARPLIEARKQDLTISQPGKRLRVNGDATRLAQVDLQPAEQRLQVHARRRAAGRRCRGRSGCAVVGADRRQRRRRRNRSGGAAGDVQPVRAGGLDAGARARRARHRAHAGAQLRRDARRNGDRSQRRARAAAAGSPCGCPCWRSAAEREAGAGGPAARAPR